MSGPKTHCRMEKRTSWVAHNHQIPGSNPGPATIAGGADPTAAGDTPGGARLPRREESRAKACVETLSAKKGRAEQVSRRRGAVRDDTAESYADSPDGCLISLRRGRSGDVSPIAGGASSSRPAGDDCRMAAGEPGAVQPPPVPRPELFSIHITLDTARLLALLATEHGDSLGGMVARLVVADIERKGGIARV